MAVSNLRHGGRPLDTALQYLDARGEDHPSLSNALAVYAQIFSIQDRFRESFDPQCPDDVTPQDPGRAIVPEALPGLDPDMPLRALAEISDAIIAAAPDRREEIESARASCGREDVIARHTRQSSNHLDPAAQTLLLLALNPFYEKFASKIIPRIEDRAWQFGHCPVCGESCSMARYEASIGARFVQCRLCRTQWALGRVRCALCGCEDSNKLGYLQAEGDSAHRVEVCDACGGYLKSVDERALGTEAILHIEELLMSALDREAIARGYSPGQSRTT